MRKIYLLVTTLALSLLGQVFNPVQAAVPVNGDYSCATGAPASSGNRYQIVNGLVILGASCTGDVVIPADVLGIGDLAFYNSALSSITIPATATSIGSGAFQDTTALTSITLQEGITSIGSSAFAGASALTSITIPTSVTSIGNGAFSRATALTSITIPANVTSIGSSAFSGATALTSITIAAKVASIGSNAFLGASALTSITVDPGNETFSSIDGVLINKSTNTLVQYPTGKTTNSYNIPNTITAIGNGAFRGATSLTSITIPTSVTSIGTSTFHGATSLTLITIPTSVTSIGNSAFFGATALSSITIPASVTSIGTSVFQNATALTSITIPTSVTSIGNSAFSGAASLTSITIPASVTSIGESAFSGATSLTSVTIPASVTRIADYTFRDATALTSVTIPASIRSIGLSAFGGASLLKDIYFFGNAPSPVSSSAFTNIARSAKAHIKSSNNTFGALGGQWNGLEVLVGVYTVSFNANDGSTVTSREYGGQVTEPTPPTRAGYTFRGWSEIDGGSTNVVFPYDLNADSDITFYGNWNANTYAVTYDSKGGTAVTNGSFTTGGAIATAPSPPVLKNYVFQGWSSINGGSTTVIFPYAPGATSDITLYAKWIKATKPVMKSAPKISGSAIKGSVLTLDDGTWTANPTPIATLQWYRCEKPVSAGISEFTKSQSCEKISGATKANYKIAVADQAMYLTALVTGKNSQGALVKSAKSVKIPGTEPALEKDPKISGSTWVGGVLRATDGTWSGIPEVTTSVRWYRCDSAVSAGRESIKKSANCDKISGATRSSYTVKRADQGKYLTVLVTAENDEGKTTATAKSIYINVPAVTP